MNKEERARVTSILDSLESVVVGYSGGVDSVLLAKLAVDTLGPGRALAVTGRSASVPSWSYRSAREVAERFGVPWLEFDTDELADPRYAANPANRCYFCKSELWGKLGALARKHGYAAVVDGTNADDAGDHRPGALAAREHGVRSPFLEAGLGKQSIRDWSRELGLPTWDQPASPCLASRIPYGTPVTPGRLRRVERAEEGLRALGLREVRVRYHGATARVELGARELRAHRLRPEIESAVRAAGFERVEIDARGYRRGSLNQGLAAHQLVHIGA